MSVAFWIAIAAVFMALIPVFIAASRKREDNKADKGGDGGAAYVWDTSSSDFSASSGASCGDGGGDGD